MKAGIRNLALAAGGAAMLAAAVPTEASATHQFGHAVAGGIIGGIIGGAIANSQPRYVAPAPVYQPAPVYVQPTCYWQNVKVYDPYLGHNVWRRQRFCN